MIYGYKCFDKGLTNRYGKTYEVGKLYHTEGEIIYGNDGHGFHMCANLEDTLRFFDTWNKEIDICKVLGFGKTILHEDDYNGYYDMYACEFLYIDHLMNRKEIIDYANKLNDMRLIRFISTYKLSPEEKEMFTKKYQDNSRIMPYIDYYQNHNKDAFTRKLQK